MGFQRPVKLTEMTSWSTKKKRSTNGPPCSHLVLFLLCFSCWSLYFLSFNFRLLLPRLVSYKSMQSEPGRSKNNKYNIYYIIRAIVCLRFDQILLVNWFLRYVVGFLCCHIAKKGNNNITELRTILQRESQNS